MGIAFSPMTISNVTWSPNTPTEKDSNVDTACMDTGRELLIFYGRKEAKALRIMIDQLARYRGKEDQHYDIHCCPHAPCSDSFYTAESLQEHLTRHPHGGYRCKGLQEKNNYRDGKSGNVN